MNLIGPDSKLKKRWEKFLEAEAADFQSIQSIDFSADIPVIQDLQGRKFSVDFVSDRKNYNKKKGSIKTEFLSKALGAGKKGLNVLDISAGLAIDAIFLMQLGYKVTALERNPIIFLALDTAYKALPAADSEKIKFIYAAAEKYIEEMSDHYDIMYFDPMFPEKKKSALPKQEMILFKQLVGSDDDASHVVHCILQSKKVSRLVVKRPLRGDFLFQKPQSSLLGKLIRFDIYGGLK